MKIAPPSQRTLDALLQPKAKSSQEPTNQRKKRARKECDEAADDAHIYLHCKGYDICEADAAHIADSLGVKRVADFLDVEEQHVTDLNLKPVITTRLKRLIKDVKRGVNVAGVKSPTSVVSVAAQAKPGPLSNPPLAFEKEISCPALHSDVEYGELVAKKLTLSPKKEVVDPMSTQTTDSSPQKDCSPGQM